MKSYIWQSAGPNQALRNAVDNPVPPRYTAGSLAGRIMDSVEIPVKITIDQIDGAVQVDDSEGGALATFVPILVDPSEATIFE